MADMSASNLLDMSVPDGEVIEVGLRLNVNVGIHRAARQGTRPRSSTWLESNGMWHNEPLGGIVPFCSEHLGLRGWTAGGSRLI